MCGCGVYGCYSFRVGGLVLFGNVGMLFDLFWGGVDECVYFFVGDYL